jgi:hypothetical protein
MKNLADGIPQWAFLNAQVTQSVRGSPAFQEAVQKVAGGYGITGYTFINPAYVASLLYCLLVVPKELFPKKIRASFNIEARPRSVSSYFVINTPPTDITKCSTDVEFLRRLRNSVAHARFEVHEDSTFVFRDRPKNDKPDNFEVHASVKKLEAFLSDVGAELANLRTQPPPAR